MGAGHAHTLYVHEHSPVHRLPPETKVLSAFLFVAAVAVTPREAIWAFGAYAGIEAALVGFSRVPARFVLSRLIAVAPFILFALFLPFIGEGKDVELLGISLSSEGTWAMWNILAKATLGATASILLAATTEVPEIVKGFGRLRVPPVITAIASFMIRYLEVVAEELGRMRTAMTARGYDPRWLSQARPIASSAGTLFVRSYERGERVYDAMLSRGYTGVMPVIDSRTASAQDWAVALMFPLLAAATATIAFVTL
ncbi:MAG: cobalt ECF transporter T component CbiQ [Acidimicrobiia bacterium]